jgi:hypothetical protein
MATRRKERKCWQQGEKEEEGQRGCTDGPTETREAQPRRCSAAGVPRGVHGIDPIPCNLTRRWITSVSPT